MLAAIETIKTSKLGLKSGAAALYELPWYMIIGNPAAGKSSAILHSGLQFPFADGKPPPALADGVQLLGTAEGSGYREPPALVRRADGQTLQLTRLLYLVLEAADGTPRTSRASPGTSAKAPGGWSARTTCGP